MNSRLLLASEFACRSPRKILETLVRSRCREEGGEREGERKEERERERELTLTHSGSALSAMILLLCAATVRACHRSPADLIVDTTIDAHAHTPHEYYSTQRRPCQKCSDARTHNDLDGRTRSRMLSRRPLECERTKQHDRRD